VTYRWDDFVLDLDRFRLERSGVALALEPKAFNLLVLFVERPGHVFTKQEIFERLWPNTAVTDHALTRVVAQLRRVLGDEARDGRYIETVPTRGYRWVPSVERRTTDTLDTPFASAPVAVRVRPRAQMLALSVVVAIILLGLVAWTQRDIRAARREGATTESHDVAWPVQLTTHAGLDLHPSFSPQGDAVVYASDRSGAFELYVRALTGPAVEVPLTRSGEHNVQPAWSPDGSVIAFHSHGRGGIWVMPARGGVARQLVTEGSNPSWSADGKRIAFQSDEPADATPSAYGAQSGATIHVVDADGRHQKPLTAAGHPLGGHAAPAWTHDGRFVAFSVFDGASNNGVWIVSIETGETKPLLQAARGLYELTFAPDDSALYAAGGEPFVTRIPFNKRDGTLAGERELIAVAGAAGVRGLSMSADGKRLAFAGLTISSQLWAQPITRDGNGSGEPHALTTDTSRRNSLPVVSPDGSRVAYVSRRGGEPPNIWVIGVDGRNSAQITDNDSPDELPYWFPDGRQIAFLSRRGDALGLWSVDLETRREELMLPLGDIATKMQAAGHGPLAEASLSGSMTTVAMSVVTSPDAHRQIFLSPTNALDARPISDPSRWVGYPAWSRDEQHLAVEMKDGSSTHAGVIDLHTGALRQITTERGQTWVRSWSPDGQKIAAAAFRCGQWDLRWIDAASGATGVITPPGAPNTYVRYPEWSPRGDLVVFERGELHGNVWTLRVPDK
jgi:Tol biopolymer transport system component/DNA-binding winged helix-turn-helix (wHTH) protein